MKHMKIDEIKNELKIYAAREAKWHSLLTSYLFTFQAEHNAKPQSTILRWVLLFAIWI